MLATQNGQFLRNAGRSESKGVEVSLQGNPVNGLMVQVNYGFTHATFKDYKDERRGIDYSGNFLPMVPRHTFAVGADYTIPNPCRHIDRFTVSGTNLITAPSSSLNNAARVERRQQGFATLLRTVECKSICHKRFYYLCDLGEKYDRCRLFGFLFRDRRKGPGTKRKAVHDRREYTIEFLKVSAEVRATL